MRKPRVARQQRITIARARIAEPVGERTKLARILLPLRPHKCIARTVTESSMDRTVMTQINSVKARSLFLCVNAG